MNYLLRKVIPGLLLLSCLAGTAWGQGKLATVDLSKLFDKYYKTQQAMAMLKDRAADAEKDLKDMGDERKKAVDEYQALLADASNQALSTEERDKRKHSAEDKLKVIRDKEVEIDNYRKQAEARITEQKQRMLLNIFGEIKTAVSAKAKAAGYNLVIDVSAEAAKGTPVVLYNSDEGNDLTQVVLDQLNVAAPADTAKATDSTADKKKDDKKK